MTASMMLSMPYQLSLVLEVPKSHEIRRAMRGTGVGTAAADRRYFPYGT
jgi:hypothetical protein